MGTHVQPSFLGVMGPHILGVFQTFIFPWFWVPRVYGIFTYMNGVFLSFNGKIWYKYK